MTGIDTGIWQGSQGTHRPEELDAPTFAEGRQPGQPSEDDIRAAMSTAVDRQVKPVTLHYAGQVLATIG